MNAPEVDTYAIRQGINPRLQTSFSWKNRLGRALWGIVYTLFFRFSPRPLHAWRAFLLKLFGARMGKGCHVYGNVKIWAPWNLTLGDYVWIGEDTICYSIAPITIGNQATVSQGSHLCTGTHDYEDPNFQLYAKPIVIGDHVWVCADAFVGPGVTIHEGAVVGARSVVIKDMPAWMVCAGHPCKPIKPRVVRERSLES